MINSIYRLTSPGLFEEAFVEVNLNDKVVIRPLYLSICQADQRYYQGQRDYKILKEKLPMALIHEAVGVVVKDFTGNFNVGDKVTMIPNTPQESDEIIAENYLKSSKFKSSGEDGFLSEFVILNQDRVLKIPDNINLKVASFIELISVAYHSIKRFEKLSHPKKEKIGVWGDGNLGFILSLLLKTIYTTSEIIVFGKNQEKLSYFTFADKTYDINDVPEDLAIDHVFECVGGFKAENAINQIINVINPQGSIALLGVSEINVAINTRIILEKGLILFGNSRSGREDFIETIQLINKNPKISNYLENLVANEITVNSIPDIVNAFNIDFNSNFGKTILEWNL
ncbi:MAG: alcohol dehydrogenase catalytic domain-containing protein [Methanobrevibacter sp.]|nr:alcohol dehydrogenase catalytic domain-containing protein [Methanobrevibacter sp.]